jgi:hypothetical protein
MVDKGVVQEYFVHVITGLINTPTFPHFCGTLASARFEFEFSKIKEGMLLTQGKNS